LVDPRERERERERCEIENKQCVKVGEYKGKKGKKGWKKKK
jgi:hypothetical protein